MTSTRTETNTRNRCDRAVVPLHPSDQWIRVGIGNYYKGEWNRRTMSGTGVYVTHDGTAYKGNFHDGLFRGIGTVYYSSGSRNEGVWERGVCTKENYIFSDGLAYQPNDWRYCRMPDRRFAIEHVNGLQPASRSLITNRQPTIEIPEGAYDTCDGLYYPKTNTVHNYWTNALVRVPTEEGAKWIMDNCRRGGGRDVRFRPEFYENWYETDEGPLSKVDSVCSERIAKANQSVMADVKSVPSSVFDLSLQNMQ